jgi:hypothetical protein
MEKETILPDYVIEKYKTLFKSFPFPNIVRTRNITKTGLEQLIEKNEIIWSYSYYITCYEYFEGIVSWGINPVLIYFKKLENDNTYKLYVLTNNLDNLDMLLIGLNKFFTIDKL